MSEAYVHTPLDSDIADPVRCVSAVLGERGMKVRKLYVYVPNGRRDEGKLRDVTNLTKAIGLSTEVVEIPFEIDSEESFIESIFRVYSKMKEGSKVIVCLGRGLGHASLILFSASIMVSDLREVEILVQSKGGSQGASISKRTLRLIASMARDKDLVREILTVLSTKKDGMRLQDIYKELTVKGGVNASRTTVHNHLKSLVSQKIIKELDGGYYSIY